MHSGLSNEQISGDYYTRRFSQGQSEDTMIINMGPQHPSTHGVLRLTLELDGEYILDILQSVSGSRLTYSFFRPGGVAFDLTGDFLTEVRAFVSHLRNRLPMYRTLVTDNIILRHRCEKVGELSLEMCRCYGATGPVLRGSGLAYDVRRAEPYGIYPELSFEIPSEDSCDVMGRYLVRMAELEQCLNILEQAVAVIADGDHLAKGAPKPRWKAPVGETYFAVQGARGKIGEHLVSDGSATPYRCKLRSLSFSHLYRYVAQVGRTRDFDAPVRPGAD